MYADDILLLALLLSAWRVSKEQKGPRIIGKRFFCHSQVTTVPEMRGGLDVRNNAPQGVPGVTLALRNLILPTQPVSHHLQPQHQHLDLRKG